jgi:hypothetical protein
MKGGGRAYPDGYLAVCHAGLAGEVVSFGVGRGRIGGEGSSEDVFGVYLFISGRESVRGVDLHAYHTSSPRHA